MEEEDGASTISFAELAATGKNSSKSVVESSFTSSSQTEAVKAYVNETSGVKIMKQAPSELPFGWFIEAASSLVSLLSQNVREFVKNLKFSFSSINVRNETHCDVSISGIETLLPCESEYFNETLSNNSFHNELEKKNDSQNFEIILSNNFSISSLEAKSSDNLKINTVEDEKISTTHFHNQPKNFTQTNSSNADRKPSNVSNKSSSPFTGPLFISRQPNEGNNSSNFSCLVTPSIRESLLKIRHLLVAMEILVFSLPVSLQEMVDASSSNLIEDFIFRPQGEKNACR